ncbi:MAG TPA: lipoyl(octanoyl) transferase LipB [Stellaceae bacterium]|jgi:lipoyl(octanoyl) transferase|nr:lipoyl(octanoyl) transferase LipB [Stellaceae bacterium]
MSPAPHAFAPHAFDWLISDEPVPYEDALARMNEHVEAIRIGTAGNLVWLLEHPPLYTAGTSAKAADLVDARFPVYEAGRGGQYTYHGPGQRVGYVMLDLKQRDNDVRRYVRDLEEWLIRTLASFNIKGERREGRVGIWIAEADGTENKIGALGVRVRHGVTFHGVSLNVDPDLTHFGGIVPCGISEHGVTSLAAQGILVSMPEVDAALRKAFLDVFGAKDRD